MREYKRYTYMNSTKEYNRYICMNRKKGTHEFTKGKLERHTGGPGRMEFQTVCWRSTLLLRHSEQQLGKTTRSKLHDLDMRIQGSQMKLPWILMSRSWSLERVDSPSC